MATYTPNLNLEKPASSDFYDISKFNANTDKIDAAVGKMLSGTLTAGETSLTISDSCITVNSIIDAPYVDVFGVAPKTMTVVAGALTMTFKVQSADLHVKVRVR